MTLTIIKWLGVALVTQRIMHGRQRSKVGTILTIVEGVLTT